MEIPLPEKHEVHEDEVALPALVAVPAHAVHLR